MHYRDLFEYNAWANNACVEVLDRLTPEQLRHEMPELGGDTLELLEHIERVEVNFLAAVNNEPRPPRPDGRTYEQIRAALLEVDSAFVAAVDALAARERDTFELAWFGRKFEVGQALLQVATHSVQHRAAVCAGMALAGHDAPNLDYIFWLNQFR